MEKRINKGFTLIELLAVIVILAVIAVIATPIVLNMIQTAKEGALKDSAYGYMSAIEYYVAQSHNDDEVLDYDLNGTVKTVSLASIKGTAPTGVNLKLSNGKVTSGSISYGDYAIIIVDGKVNDITKTKVTVTLVGDEVINHPAGTTFTDPGATAYDLIDEDITSLITTEGTVDINTIGTYTITYTVINSGGIAASKTRKVNITDSEKPVITITGDNPYTHQAGDTYPDLGATASDNVDGDITSNIQTSSNVVDGIVGTYEVTYTVTDANGNTQSSIRTVNVVDTTKPNVTFGTNGNSTYAKSYSTTVTISDNAELNQDSFKYLWSKTSTGIVEGDFTTSFNNGDTLSTPAGATGSYYLWFLAKDSAANTTITKSNVFNLDNTAPVTTLSGNASLNYVLGTTTSYSDAGASATDNIDGLITSKITTIIPEIITFGTYYVTYDVTDTVGNSAAQVKRKIVVNQFNVEYLIVAGGGGGSWGGNSTAASTGGGGGGGGGFLEGNQNLTLNINEIVVGAGGRGGYDILTNRSGKNGENSSAFSLVAIGGGGGSASSIAPTTGGSGGGSGNATSSASAPGANGTIGQGNNGGAGLMAYASGGGGGAGAAGSNATSTNAGNGGVGKQTSITGTNTYYAGGGGGSCPSNCNVRGLGGNGGGGAGAIYKSAIYSGSNATANTGGGGGGGGGEAAKNPAGGNGGSGIVIIRYYGLQKANGGEITTQNGYTIHTFTSSGTFTINN